MDVTASQMTPTSSRPSTLIPSYPQTPREEHVNTFFRKINEWERVHWQGAATENRGIASGLADVCGHESLSHDSTDSHWKAVQRERNGSAVSAIHKAFYCWKNKSGALLHHKLHKTRCRTRKNHTWQITVQHEWFFGRVKQPNTNSRRFEMILRALRCNHRKLIFSSGVKMEEPSWHKTNIFLLCLLSQEN